MGSSSLFYRKSKVFVFVCVRGVEDVGEGCETSDNFVLQQGNPLRHNV